MIRQPTISSRRDVRMERVWLVYTLDISPALYLAAGVGEWCSRYYYIVHWFLDVAIYSYKPVANFYVFRNVAVLVSDSHAASPVMVGLPALPLLPHPDQLRPLLSAACQLLHFVRRQDTFVKLHIPDLSGQRLHAFAASPRRA